MSANDEQVGGDHYRKAASGGQQHWDRAWEKYREAWFVLNITKYVERYRLKDGIKDLEKARHYLDKLIELERRELAELKAVAEAESRRPPNELLENLLDGRSYEVVQDGHGFGHQEWPREYTDPKEYE